jgi:DNA modification methylase
MGKAKVIIGDSRNMIEIENNSIDLIITSPPYWHIKNYKIEGQIGYGQTLHEYLKSLYIVWQESFRVLKPGNRLCINVGDQFLRSIIYGRYKVAPLHSEIISQCEQIGFDYMGAIIWQKKTTMNTTGGANIMGSYPYPPNGLIEIDYEFILIFKKPGKNNYDKTKKEKSKLTKEEWKEYFSGHWNFNGEKQIEHEAMFPEELPKRLIKMFSFVDDIVLDPFLGSGTTIKAALNLNRNAIGYEINEKFIPIIKEKIGFNTLLNENEIQIIEREKDAQIKFIDKYKPGIQDIKPMIEPDKFNFSKERLYKIIKILSPDTIELDTGLIVKLLGVKINNRKVGDLMKYYDNFIVGKQVYLKFDEKYKIKDKIVPAYLFLKNKIFINKELIKLNFANVAEYDFKYKNNFIKIKKEVLIG